MKISVVILSKNEESRIEKCLKSVIWADEVIVIDDYSEDKSREIARKLGAKVYKRALCSDSKESSLNCDFAAQRNYGLEKAKNVWVLFVDADEIVSPELAAELKAKLFGDLKLSFKGFRIKRVDYLWGRELKHGDVGNVELIRLARKDAGRWKRAVHEYWDVDTSQVGKFDNPLLHYPHENVAQFLDTVRKYSLIHAQVLEKEGVKSNVFQLTVFPVGKFLVNYILKLGFLDGTAGFVHAMMMSFHSFLARSQLWLQQHKYPNIKKRHF